MGQVVRKREGPILGQKGDEKGEDRAADSNNYRVQSII